MNRSKSVYRSFFKWSFEIGRIPINPAASLHLAKTNSQRTTPISIEEINCLLEVIGKSNDPTAGRDEALFATYAFTGIRRSEALAIKVKDYDSSSKILFLPKTKRGNNYMPPVPSRLDEILDKRIFNLKKNSHNIACLPFFSGRRPERPLSARQAHARFDKWKRISGIRKKLTIHSFRAGYATLLHKTTGDLFLVARVMGHRNINTTERYVENNTFTIREAIEKMFR